MSLPVTTGNWTAEAIHVDSQPTPIMTPELYVAISTEYSASVTPPSKDAKIDNDQVMYYTDITGDSIISPGSLSVGRSRLSNIYTDSTIPAALRAPVSSGHKAHVQLNMRYRLKNSVSGIEYEFPMKGSYTVSVPDWSAIPVEVFYDFLAHLNGCACEIVTQSGVQILLPNRLLSVLRGDLTLT